jgi:superoxide dismutase, Cu-Zn family
MARHILVLVLMGVAVTGCAVFQAQKAAATATVVARSGSAVSGTVSLQQVEGGVRMHVELVGLAPNSEHGFHVHEKGDCSAADATSAGGHFNPDQSPHGSAGSAAHHAGDLPSLTADATGKIRGDLLVQGVTLDSGPRSIVGRSVIVHRDRDDFVTQPSGNAGARVGCGVIVATSGR